MAIYAVELGNLPKLCQCEAANLLQDKVPKKKTWMHHCHRQQPIGQPMARPTRANVAEYEWDQTSSPR